MPHPTPASAGFAVPVVDISAYTHGGTAEAKALVSRQMDAACSTVGFDRDPRHYADALARIAPELDVRIVLPGIEVTVP